MAAGPAASAAPAAGIAMIARPAMDHGRDILTELPRLDAIFQPSRPPFYILHTTPTARCIVYIMTVTASVTAAIAALGLNHPHLSCRLVVIISFLSFYIYVFLYPITSMTPSGIDLYLGTLYRNAYKSLSSDPAGQHAAWGVWSGA